MLHNVAKEGKKVTQLQVAPDEQALGSCVIPQLQDQESRGQDGRRRKCLELGRAQETRSVNRERIVW